MSIFYQSNRPIEINLDLRMIELSKCQYFTNQIELSRCILLFEVSRQNNPEPCFLNRTVEMNFAFRTIEMARPCWLSYVTRCQYFTNQIELSRCILFFEWSNCRDVNISPIKIPFSNYRNGEALLVVLCHEMSILHQSNRAVEMYLVFRMIELSRCQYFTNQNRVLELSNIREIFGHPLGHHWRP